MGIQELLQYLQQMLAGGQQPQGPLSTRPAQIGPAPAMMPQSGALGPTSIGPGNPQVPSRGPMGPTQIGPPNAFGRAMVQPPQAGIPGRQGQDIELPPSPMPQGPQQPALARAIAAPRPKPQAPPMPGVPSEAGIPSEALSALNMPGWSGPEAAPELPMLASNPLGNGMGGPVGGQGAQMPGGGNPLIALLRAIGRL